MDLNILKIDPYLEPYKTDLEQRMKNYKNKRAELVGEKKKRLIETENGEVEFTVKAGESYLFECEMI